MPKHRIILGSIAALALTAILAGLQLLPAGNPDVSDLPSGLSGFVSLPGMRFSMGSREGGHDALPREVVVNPFFIATHETTVSEFVGYLNAQPDPGSTPHPQTELRGSKVHPLPGLSSKPVAHVTYEEAQNYCSWLSKKLGFDIRLPTEEEWEGAARGGLARARFPWGWGPPDTRACFDAGEAEDVASYEANSYGLYDMAGNVFEWCTESDPNTSSERHVARGGSWSERDERFLRVFHRTWFPADYRDADVGFRVVAAEPRITARAEQP